MQMKTAVSKNKIATEIHLIGHETEREALLAERAAIVASIRAAGGIAKALSFETRGRKHAFRKITYGPDAGYLYGIATGEIRCMIAVLSS
jgi:hypothetical protein